MVRYIGLALCFVLGSAALDAANREDGRLENCAVVMQEVLDVPDNIPQELLEKAFASRGRHRPVLAAGRDGVHVPIRQDGYHEGAAATLSVRDRRGKRLGTVYLGRMPEPGQGTLSAQLTNLLERTLARWHALGRPAPRLAYLTDGGHHPKEYYLRTLRRLDDPWRPGRKLQWQWVLDFWHACGHLGKLAEALFGEGAKAKQRFAQWRRWLRDRRRGITQVLRSAMGLHNRVARERVDWLG